jgi:hypothetical protein
VDVNFLFEWVPTGFKSTRGKSSALVIYPNIPDVFAFFIPNKKGSSKLKLPTLSSDTCCPMLLVKRAD